MATWKDLTEVLPYGYSLVYALKVEGIPYLFVEKNIIDLSVIGYTIDESLQITDSARVGSVIDEATGIGRAFDLTVGLERTAATEDLFKKPSNICRLDADFAYNDTVMIVDSTAGFASSGNIYIGVERISHSGIHPVRFTGCVRGLPATDWRGYSYDSDSSVSTWVTDGPLRWRGRRAKLFAVPVDPSGRATPGNFTTDSVEIWTGHIATDPRPYPNGWSLSARSLDRRLDMDIGSGLSGTARLLPNPDPKYMINPDMTVSFSVDVNGFNWAAVNTVKPWKQIAPFATLSDSTYYNLSELKGYFGAAWASLIIDTLGGPVTTYFTGESKWIPGGPFHSVDGQEPAGWGQTDNWSAVLTEQFHVRCKTENTTNYDIITLAEWTNFNVAGQPSAFSYFLLGQQTDMIGYGALSSNNFSSVSQAGGADENYHWVGLPVLAMKQNTLNSLEITLDDEDPALVPSTGYITLRGDGTMMVFEYTNKSVIGDVINLEVANTSMSIKEVANFFGDANKDTVSCSFSFKDEGQVRDTARRMLMSSGRGDNDGTYDTLPSGQGYDIEEVNTGSFDSALDGGWSDFSADFLIDESTSFVSLYGHLIALSQHAIVPRSEGTDITVRTASIELTAVPTTVIETAEYEFTLTDAHLIGGKTGSVRALNRPTSANRVAVSLKRAEADMGRVIVNDIVSQRADGVHAWAFDVNGFTKDELTDNVLAWSRSLFTARSGRLIYEVTCVPWVDCQVGDAIRVESTHFNLWNRSTGARGYTGTARVLGRQTELKTQRTVLTIGIAGAYQTMSLCPSALVKWHRTNAFGLLTGVKVEMEYYKLFKAY